jgi:ribosomal protein S18 acetylase RimI-like enzyme
MTDGGRRRVVVRGARPADGARVAAMVRALAVSEGKAPSGFSAADFARDGFGPNPRFTCLVAARGRALLGYAIYYPAYDAATPSHGLHLLDLWVEPDARNDGIGTALIEEVSRRCRDAGGTWITLHVRRQNAARALYTRLGGVPLRLLFLAIEGDALTILTGDS